MSGTVSGTRTLTPVSRSGATASSVSSTAVRAVETTPPGPVTVTRTAWVPSAVRSLEKGIWSTGTVRPASAVLEGSRRSWAVARTGSVSLSASASSQSCSSARVSRVA
ncbi:hypothetical protein C5C67_06755 [Rathayibacter sp. AY1E1]|nr:hypothetical protein C5C67_06755 [Rathayibacter sp. AY1E1]